MGSRDAATCLIAALAIVPMAHAADSAPSPSLAAGRPDPFEAAQEAGLRPVEARTAAADPPAVLLRGATILSAAGTRIEKGWILLRGGRIEALGDGEPPAATASAAGITTLDMGGRFITPGLIDTHSHLGVYPSPGARAHGDGNEATAPTTPGVWAEHSFWPQDPGLSSAVAGGVTAIQVLPGSANLIGGRGVVLEMRPERGARAMRFPGAPETVKMACGENPKRVYGEKGAAPSTRMGNIRATRAAFLKARRYLDAQREWLKKRDFEAEKREKEAKKKGKGMGRAADSAGAAGLAPAGGEPETPPAEGLPPELDLDLETLAGILEGRFLPQVHCYRADDMLSMLQIADEFGFSIRSFHHALEAYKIRDVLANRGVASSTWADWWGFKLEAFDGIPENAALLTEAGARAIIHSDSAIGIQRLNQEAGKAYFSGLHAGVPLSEDQALRWVTLNAAWALGIDTTTGSLEAGKRADVVVWSGHPFSVYSRAELVFVGGSLAWDASQPRDWSDFELGWEIEP